MLLNDNFRLEEITLFEKFKSQMHKDFELAGVLNYLPNIETNNYNQLLDLFANCVLKLEGINSLQNLLYRIDISELQIKQACLKTNTNSLQMVVADLILKRILQKVVLKQKFSS